MAIDSGEEVPAIHARRLRVVEFPIDSSPVITQRQITVARMLGVEPDELAQQEAEDDIPDFWRQLNGASAANPSEEKSMANEQQAEKILASGWDEVAKASASAGAWMKWENNQVHTINIFGKPVFFEKTWDGEVKRRVRVEVFVPDENAVKQWEMAPGTLRDLVEERADAKNPFDDALFAVKRTGMGKETRFKMRYQRQLTAQEIAARSDAGAASGVDAGDPF